MISGDRGVLAYLRLSSEIENYQNELELVRAERINLEHKANLLKNYSIDPDLLEESAKTYGYAKPNEEIYIDND